MRQISLAVPPGSRFADVGPTKNARAGRASSIRPA